MFFFLHLAQGLVFMTADSHTPDFFFFAANKLVLEQIKYQPVAASDFLAHYFLNVFLAIIFQ